MVSPSCCYVYGLILLLLLAVASAASCSTLSPYYYDQVCPDALTAIKGVVEAAVGREPRMGASLLRLHFHDCFVDGCDASLLLDPSPTIDSEKNAGPNANSIRGFEVIDQIKSEVDKVCGGSVVSCADILAVAARDSVVALGGPTWKVELGRKDSTTASRTNANTDIPTPLMDLPQLINNFKNKGLDEEDLVALSGGHTLGFAQCRVFRNRIYNETNTIDPEFASQLQASCPQTGGNTSLASLDPTYSHFDIAYFTNLEDRKGLLHSDQQLFSGGSTDELVLSYTSNPEEFWEDFAKSMVKMGNIKPLTGNQGQVRFNCRKVN